MWLSGSFIWPTSLQYQYTYIGHLYLKKKEDENFDLYGPGRGIEFVE
jgi:hypothetical protein